MAEILSQKEIDELLNALSTGDIDVLDIEDQDDDTRAKEYDFKRPNKFAKDQLRTLEVIYENFARTMSSYLSGILRTYCQAEVVSVEPLTFHEFNNSLPEPVILNIISFRPLKGSIMMAISPDMSYSIIDKMLGGSGANLDEVRDFTEIELTLIERVIRQFLILMSDAWSNVIESEFKLDRIETNAQFAQIMSPNEPIAIITLRVQVGEREGMINVCIPHIVIEPISNQLTTKYWYKSQMAEETDESSVDIISKRIQSTPLNLRAILGDASITIRELLDLQVGDVICLEKAAQDDLDVMVENIKRFTGKVGIKNKKLAVQITRIEREGLEDE
ncbi:MAG: flagellar motor switch protein FliM [Clostridiales bacterium]|nr:flagellar motor switch protein FliM [Clostridiales bacterium]